MEKKFTYTPSKSLKRVFENLKDIYLNDGFYVVCDKSYTATVRNLNNFITYISKVSLDDTFGEITKISTDKESHNFYAVLLDIISQYKGFATFNVCKHTFVECTEKNQTISIKTKEGKRITVSIIGGVCADIHYGDANLENHENGSEDGIKQFEVIGFRGGETPVEKTPVTLATIML